MSYTPTTWKAGDVITAAKLNKLEKGVQNEQVGPQGAPGAAGSDGLTPTIGENGNWFLGDTDTGKPSRGEAGPAGADGAPGAAGEPGAPGADGEDGVGVPAGGTAGQILGKVSDVDYDTAWVDPPSGGGGTGTDGVGIQSMEQTTHSTESGGLNVWTATLTDGNTYDLEVRNGEAGKDGEPGTDGAPGADGLTPTIGENGNWYLGEEDTGKPSRGETGPAGADGVSPTITENAGNSATVYKLDIKTADGEFTTPNLQAVSFVENAEVYSTEETVVGQWIDGKPVYRTTFYNLTFTNNATLLTEIDLLINQHGIIYNKSGVQIPIPFLESDSNVIRVCVGSNNMYINAAGGNANNAGALTVEYTKTTDTATIAIPTAAEMTAAYDEGVQAA